MKNSVISSAAADIPGKLSTPELARMTSQSTLMLIESLGLKSLLGGRSDDESGDLSAAVGDVGCVSLIKGEDEHAAALERRAGDEGRDVGLQPGIRFGESAVVGVVHNIGRDEGILRQRVAGEVSGKLRKRHYICSL